MQSPKFRSKFSKIRVPRALPLSLFTVEVAYMTAAFPAPVDSAFRAVAKRAASKFRPKFSETCYVEI